MSLEAPYANSRADKRTRLLDPHTGRTELLPDETKDVTIQGSAPTDALLQERGSTHGDFGDHARITMTLKRVMEREPNWDELSDVQRESLHMIVHKIGRVLAGNPDHQDHWDDIAGYARLVSQRL